METTAKLTQITNATEGTSQKGPWRKATVVFETQEQYPKTIAVDFFNTRLEQATKIPLGTVCKVGFDISSREFNGKWYTNLNGFSIEAVAMAPSEQAQQAYNPQPTCQQPQQPSCDAPVPQLGDDNENNDLPF